MTVELADGVWGARDRSIEWTLACALQHFYCISAAICCNSHAQRWSVLHSLMRAPADTTLVKLDTHRLQLSTPHTCNSNVHAPLLAAIIQIPRRPTTIFFHFRILFFSRLSPDCHLFGLLTGVPYRCLMLGWLLSGGQPTTALLSPPIFRLLISTTSTP